MATPVFDFVHAINGLKSWPNWQPLDFQSTMDPTDAVYAVGGRCVHVDPTAGTFKLGCTGVQMPLFLIHGPTAFDVANDGGTAWQAGFPKGDIAAVVATGGFELDTTEFDTASTFHPNDLLKSPDTSQITPGAGVADAGRLYNAKKWAGGGNGALTLYTDTSVGLVSRGTRVNDHRVNVLSFWPHPVFGTA